MTRAPTTDLSLEEIDFGNTELWNRSDWDGMFAKLRHERPVSWHSEPEIEGLAARGPGFWSLTKYEDVQHASRHPASQRAITLSGCVNWSRLFPTAGHQADKYATAI